MFFSDFIEVTNFHELVNVKGFDLETVAFVSPFNDLDEVETLNMLKSEYPHVAGIHGPFKGMDFSSDQQDIINGTYYAYDRFHRYAKELGAKHIVVHCCLGNNKAKFEAKVKASVAFWSTYLSTHRGINYYIENVAESSWEFQKAIIDKVEAKNLKACLDIGHVNVNSNYPISKWIEELNDRIGHVHLHNNNGVKDLHMGIFQGAIPIKDVIESLNRFTSQSQWCLETAMVNESIKFLKKEGYMLA